MGIIARIRDWNQGRKWVVLYSGTDSKRFDQTVQKLRRAGIEYRDESTDQRVQASSAAASTMPGSNPFAVGGMKRTPDVSSGSVVVAGMDMMHGSRKPYCVLKVHARDMVRASRL